MSKTIRIGVQLAPQHAEYDDIRRAAVRFEQMGVDILYNWDHFFPLWGDPEGKHFECWTMLGSWAEMTERVEIGALVTCNSYRNPHLLADMARTVDHISGGRLILGIGSGWFEKDYTEYEYAYGSSGGRLREMEVGLYKIRRRLAQLNPPPTRDIPVLIGGGGEQVTLRLTAQYADIWHGFGSPDVIRRKNMVLDEWCARLGRDPAQIERAVGVDVDKPVETGDALLEAGATQVTIGLNGPHYDPGPVADWVGWARRKNRT